MILKFLVSAVPQTHQAMWAFSGLAHGADCTVPPVVVTRAHVTRMFVVISKYSARSGLDEMYIAPEPTLGAVCLEPKHRPIPIVVGTHAPRCGLAPLASPHADFLIARATCATERVLGKLTSGDRPTNMR